MASRELVRRLALLEVRRASDGIRYTVSDKPLSDEEWKASLEGRLVDEPDDLGPLLTEAEWVDLHGAGK